MALLALAASTAACQLYFTDHSDQPGSLGSPGHDGGTGQGPDGGANNDGGDCNGSGYLPDGGVIGVPDAWPAADGGGVGPDAWPAADGGVCCNYPPDAGQVPYPDASAP